MHRNLAAALLATTASLAMAVPAVLAAPATQTPATPAPAAAALARPPAGARHFTISSTAGQHGDVWSWTAADGRLAYRMSMSLRGWVTEDDALVTLGPDRRPVAMAVRGYTDQGDATEDFSVDAAGLAHWKTVIDSGSAPFGDRRYSAYGGPWLAGELDIEALVAAGDKGIDMLPTGHASLRIGPSVQIDGPR
jgi:hypothetical protein